MPSSPVAGRGKNESHARHPCAGAVCHAGRPGAGCIGIARVANFADGVIAYEGELLGGSEFLLFDQQAVKLLKAQKHKARLLVP